MLFSESLQNLNRDRLNQIRIFISERIQNSFTEVCSVVFLKSCETLKVFFLKVSNCRNIFLVVLLFQVQKLFLIIL